MLGARKTFTRFTHTASSSRPPPTAIVMLNMGGPGSLDGPTDGVQPFLGRLFGDPEIIGLGPLQRWLGPMIARNRAPRIREQYAAIGGCSPIGKWTAAQGQAMTALLNEGLPPGAAPFKAYTAFRYSPPLTASALTAMAEDGVTRAVAFPQYPQWSCTTSGSSMNEMWRETLRLGLEGRFTWSVIDRWHSHPGFLDAVARRVALGLASLPPSVAANTVIVFSAHSLPALVVNRGDAYVPEVAATVGGVVARLRAGVDVGDGTTSGGNSVQHRVVTAVANPHVLSWQSKVGFLPWQGPSTHDVIKGLAAQGATSLLLVPIAFTSDHIETLFEIDIEYAELAKKSGIAHFARAPSLNDEPLLAAALADLVTKHMAAPQPSPSYRSHCAGCVNPGCRTLLNPVEPYEHTRRVWPNEAEAKACRERKEVV